MSAFDAPDSAAQRYDALLSAPPASPMDVGPSLMDGFGADLAKIPVDVVAKASLNVMSSAITPTKIALGHALNNQDIVDEANAQQARIERDYRENFAAPATTGQASQVLIHGLAVPLAEWGLASASGGRLIGAGYAGLTTYNTAKIGYEAQGVDPLTAHLLALGQGAVAGGTSLIPGGLGASAKEGVSLGVNALRVGGAQAGVNLVTGVGTRAATQAYLANNGYAELAAQVHPFAAGEGAVDAALGFGLGFLHTRYLGHPPSVRPGARPGETAPPGAEPPAPGAEPLTPSGGEGMPPDEPAGGSGAVPQSPTLDDAMTVNSAGHAAVDLAPGVPADVDAINAHADALQESTLAELAGDPVKVNAILEGQHFLPDAPEVEAERAQLHADAADAMTEQAQARDADRAAALELPAAEPAKAPERVATPAADDEHIARLPPEQQQVLRDMYEKAADEKPAFDATLRRIAGTIPGGDVDIPDELKGTKRAADKIMSEYVDEHGVPQAARIGDLLRGTVVSDSVQGTQDALAAFDAQYPGGKVKRNGFAPDYVPDADGYRDIMVKANVNGHTSELQIHLPEMLAAKKRVHKLYKERSDLERLANDENRLQTPEEIARIDELNAQMRAEYEPAYQAALSRDAQSRRNWTSESEAPSSRASPGSNLRGEAPSNAAQFIEGIPERMTTGTPSTLKNEAPLGNESGKAAIVATSTPSIPENEPAGQKSPTPASIAVDQGLKGNEGAVNIGGQYVPVTWMVVDAKAIEPTLDKGETQARDRSRAASAAQVASIAANIDFRQLGDSPLMDYGAPTLASDGRVVGGNGRVLAINRAYETGNGEAYAGPMRQALEQFGIDPKAAEGMQKPMLVRVLPEGADVRRAALASNEGGGARMSPLEQAAVDAERLPPLGGFAVPEDGDLNTPANRDFIKNWIGNFPGGEQAHLVAADGSLSQTGLARLRNALLVKAYGDSPTLERMVETADPAGKNLSSALTKASPPVAHARAQMELGNLYKVDPTPSILAAVEKFVQLKETGQRVADYLNQGELGGPELDPQARKMLAYFEQNARSGRRMADMIAGAFRELERRGNPDDIFGAHPEPSIAELVDAGIQAADHPGVMTGSLFGAPDSFPGTAAAPRSQEGAAYEAQSRVEQAKSDGDLYGTAADCSQRAPE